VNRSKQKYKKDRS